MPDSARERALQLLAQVDETLDRAAIAAAERSIRGEQDDPVPMPDWRGKTTTASMTQAEFSCWVDEGKPPLVAADEQPSPRERRAARDHIHESIALRAQLRREMQRHVQQRLEQFAELMGEETAIATKALRDEIAQLRAELASRDAGDAPPKIKLIGGRGG